MPLVTALTTILVAVVLIGCGDSDERVPTTVAEPAQAVPAGAEALVRGRADVVAVECSRNPEFIGEILSAYPAVDFVATPGAACVVELEGGGILDLLRIQRQWIEIRRDRHGVTP